MAIHNWNLVPAGILHDFHNSWIIHLKEILNAGILPPDYYALGEQKSGEIGPDVLTLHSSNEYEVRVSAQEKSNGGLLAVAEAPPKVSISQEAQDIVFYLAKQRSLVIRHVSGDRIVAMIEIVSPANKHSADTIADFVKKALTVVQAGVHLLVIDIFPFTQNDPMGFHGLIWERMGAGQYNPSSELPLTLVSYCSKTPPTAYVEPLALGKELTDMPLFLSDGHHIPVPLESTYQQSWAGVPQRWRQVLEG